LCLTTGGDPDDIQRGHAFVARTRAQSCSTMCLSGESSRGRPLAALTPMHAIKPGQVLDHAYF
jgi:hypothetical protein